MSLKINILANYVSQVYVTLIGIVMVPLYIKYMGAEAYGLVGFYSMLQVWFSMLDLGLTPTIARETARFRGGAIDALNYRRLVRALEGIFIIIAIVGFVAIIILSEGIANDWLQVSNLSVAEVQKSVQLMAGIIAMRWMCGLYRGVISGSERLVWLGGYNSIIATVRFIGVFPILLFINQTPKVFFNFQFIVATLELAGLLFYAYKLLPNVSLNPLIPWCWSPVKPLLKFSLTIAFTSSVWILVTQTDKLVLSKFLTLAEYGYFTLAVMVASGVILLIGPVTAGIMPRLVKFSAEGNESELVRLYRSATQLVAVIVGSASVTIAYCSEPLLWVWTGSTEIAHQAKPILILYVLGNGFLAVAGFPYLLQYAKGDLRLHLIGNALFVVILIPCIIAGTIQFGAVGAGWVWLSLNLLTLIVWVPFVHSRLIPRDGLSWLVNDVAIIYLSVLISGYILNQLIVFEGGRMRQFTLIFIFGFIVLFAGCLASAVFRKKAKVFIKAKI